MIAAGKPEGERRPAAAASPFPIATDHRGEESGCRWTALVVALAPWLPCSRQTGLHNRSPDADPDPRRGRTEGHHATRLPSARRHRRRWRTQRPGGRDLSCQGRQVGPAARSRWRTWRRHHECQTVPRIRRPAVPLFVSGVAPPGPDRGRAGHRIQNTRPAGGLLHPVATGWSGGRAPDLDAVG